jgi:hypothetical protein
MAIVFDIGALQEVGQKKVMRASPPADVADDGSTASRVGFLAADEPA